MQSRPWVEPAGDDKGADGTHPSTREVLVIALVFCVFLLVMDRLAGPIHDLMRSFAITVRSEYRVPEQLSKFFLLLVILLGLHGYHTARRSVTLVTGIGFTLLGLAMYLSESNMLQEWAQPLAGACLGLPLMWLLLKNRSLVALAALVGGFTLIGLGTLADVVNDTQALRQYAVMPMAVFVRKAEETLDLAGTGLICMAAVLRFSGPALHFQRDNSRGVGLLVSSALGIAFGNGLMHYQYQPGPTLKLIGLLLALAGSGCLVWMNRLSIAAGKRVVTGHDGYLGTSLLTLFVLLPSTFGIINLVVVSVLWIPTLALLGVLLYVNHPHAAHARLRRGDPRADG